MIYAPHSIINPMIAIQRERLLPLPGQVLVRQDQKVSSLDVVAETDFSQKHSLINIASLLRISPAEADSFIKCQVGDKLVVNQLIAPARGFFSRPVLSPYNGQVILVGEGQVLMEVGESKHTLLAYYPGMITAIFRDRGVEITTEGTVIQGIWGNGQMSSGYLRTLSGMESPGDLLKLDQFTHHIRGAILIAGHCNDRRVLKKAADLPLNGLILGSISSNLLNYASMIKLPIMVTDGFGHHPMNSRVYELLTSNIDQEVALISNVFDPYTGVRPEIIIPLPLSRNPPLVMDAEILSAGSQVRIIRNPGIARIGVITKLIQDPIRQPSGLELPSAQVKFENGQVETIPLVNLEAIL